MKTLMVMVGTRGILRLTKADKVDRIILLTERYNMTNVYLDTKANTEVSEFKIIDDEKNTPTLKEAQDFVGGMVECITWPNGDLLIVNEEGKLMQLPLNPEATLLWRMTFTKDKYVTGYNDFVVGPAIYIKKHALKNWA